ncbi:MAG: phosphomannose isomerase type II C-terminal cupin domain [Candidatus Aminicenantes bacterium]|nr:phosphomannose isomerase type II C-terminal cupin domain [Candidatus Aminicenantes bacterium]
MPEEKANQETDITEFKKFIIEDIRPWGKFRSFPYKPARNIKIITVSPGGILSLQYHDNRSEFWVILDKGLEITLGDQVWQPEENEEIFIPRKAPHRLKCIGSRPARVMEIWIGDSDESDITRLDDIYGRKET